MVGRMRRVADTMRTRFGDQAAAAPEEWEQAARAMLDEGRPFHALELCRDALRAHPGSVRLTLCRAIALSQAGAVDEACRLLVPLMDRSFLDEGPFRRLQESLRAAVHSLDDRESMHALAAVADLANAIDMARGRRLAAGADAETCTVLGHIFRRAWLQSGDRQNLNHCRELFLRAFRTGSAPRDGLQAALTSLLLGDRAQARRLASRVKGMIAPDGTAPADADYPVLATLALACLLLDEGDAAMGAFQAAHAHPSRPAADVATTLSALDTLRHCGVAVPDEVEAVVRPPALVVFSAPAADMSAGLNAENEAGLRAGMARYLTAVDARIGYAMAGSGPDLLFMEAMLERGAEVNVVLPFALDDVIAHGTRRDGARWEHRLRNALALAASVTYATRDRASDDAVQHDFAGRCRDGLAWLRAADLHATPHVLAATADAEGGSALTTAPPDIPAMTAPGPSGRTVRCLLFCDLGGGGAPHAENVPAFLDFLTRLRQEMAAAGSAPTCVEVWGGTIFAAMDSATAMAAYALTLQQAIITLGADMHDRFGRAVQPRIWLDAAPVVETVDPFCGRTAVYGLPMAQAGARKAVTVDGHVHATLPFVALLTAEAEHQPLAEKIVAEYVGTVPSIPEGGAQVVYHLRRHSGASPQPPAETAPESEAAPLDAVPGDAMDMVEAPGSAMENALAAVARMMERAEKSSGSRRKPRKKKTEDTDAPELAFGDE